MGPQAVKALRGAEINSRLQEGGRSEVGLLMISSLLFNFLGQGAREGPPNPPPNSEAVCSPCLPVGPHPAPDPARLSSRSAFSCHCPTIPTAEAENSYPTTPHPPHFPGPPSSSFSGSWLSPAPSPLVSAWSSHPPSPGFGFEPVGALRAASPALGASPSAEHR